MIQNEQELKGSYETLSRLNRLRETCAEEPLWSQEMRTVVVEGIEIQIRRIEEEISVYLGQRVPQVA